MGKRAAGSWWENTESSTPLAIHTFLGSFTYNEAHTCLLPILKSKTRRVEKYGIGSRRVWDSPKKLEDELKS